MIFEEKPPKCGSLLGFSYPPLASITKETKHLDYETQALTCRSRRRSLKWLPQPRPCSQPPEL